MTKKPFFYCTIFLSTFVTYGMSYDVPIYAESKQNNPTVYNVPAHITEEYEAPETSMKIDADILKIPETVYTGTLSFMDVPLEKAKELYGDPEKWKESDFLQDADCMEYRDAEEVLAYTMTENHFFSLEGSNGTVEIPETERITEEEAEIMAESAIDTMGVKAEVLGRFAQDSDPDGMYSYKFGGMIENALVASSSSVWSQGSVEITGDKFSYVYYSCNYEPKEKTEVELLDFDEILEKVQTYAKAGFIGVPDNGLPVTRISLEYYVEHGKNDLEFRPIWNFQVAYIADDAPWLMGKDMDDLFYIDAQTGMLVQTMYR